MILWLGSLACAPPPERRAGPPEIVRVTGPIEVFGRRLDAARLADADAATEVLLEELGRYPPALLDDLLDRIYVASKITDAQGGLHTGTSNCGAHAIAVNHQQDSEGGRGWVARSLHHELSHLLVCTHPEIEAPWAALSTGTISDGSTSSQITRDPRMLERGWITTYAARSLHEDLAELSSVMMVRPGALDEIAAAHPIIAEKRAFVEQWYRDLGIVITSQRRPSWLDATSPAE